LRISVLVADLAPFAVIDIAVRTDIGAIMVFDLRPEADFLNRLMEKSALDLIKAAFAAFVGAVGVIVGLMPDSSSTALLSVAEALVFADLTPAKAGTAIVIAIASDNARIITFLFIVFFPPFVSYRIILILSLEGKNVNNYGSFTVMTFD